MAKARRQVAGGSIPVPDGFFLLRTPLLPAATLARFAAEGGIPVEGGDPGSASFADWVAEQRARERAALAAIIGRPDVREALFVASPTLVESLEVWETAPDSRRGQSVEAALFRYVERMSERPTPFGLFAGTTLGTTGDRTALALGPRAGYRRYTRLDYDTLECLTAALADDPALRPDLAFVANSSIYRVGDRVRFVESVPFEWGRRYVLSAVDAIPALEAALAAAGGGQPLSALAAAITRDDPDIPLADALDFVAELVDAGLLVPRLTPTLTGPEAIHGIIAELDGHGAAAPLEKARTLLAALDERGLGQPPAAYREVAATLEPLAVSEEPCRFQVDLWKPAVDVTLGGEVLAELVRGVGLLARLDRGDAGGVVGPFARAFARRFGDEEVPLPIAIDPEFGVGLGDGADDDPTSVLAGQGFGRSTPSPAAWTTPDQRLLELLGPALARRQRAIELSESMCRSLEVASRSPLPSSFGAVAALHAQSAEALEDGDFELELSGLVGPSGANLFGRFCHASPELTTWVERHLRAEEAERPDAIFAEIVHWPALRPANVVARPILRDHEIVFLARGGAPFERQIRADDLLVSVRAGRVVLRSRRLGREVIPRLTSAHWAGQPRNASLYRLLGELAGQGEYAGMAWSWGSLGMAPFLPRVASGRIILSPARWTLTGDRIAGLTAPPTASERLWALGRLRADLELPRHVALVEADQVLPVDLDSVLSSEAFLHAVRAKKTIALIEHIGAHAGAAASAEGGFRAQLQVPFRFERPRPSQSPAVPATPIAAPRESGPPPRFPPGTDWLYLQVFAGVSTLDRALLRLAPLVAEAEARGHIDRWFFVRYEDPSWHLRLRLHGAADTLWSGVLQTLQPVLAELMAKHGVTRIAHDTYEPEVARYGGLAGVDLAERVFHVDSSAVARCLPALVGDENAAARFHLALTSADVLLTALVPDFPTRQALIEGMRDRLAAADLGGGPEIGRWLGQYARRERAALESVGRLDDPPDPSSVPLCAIWAAHRPALAALGDELSTLERTNRLEAGSVQVAETLVHMHLNRLLRSDHRRQEAVVYDLLARVYRTRRAKGHGP